MSRWVAVRRYGSRYVVIDHRGRVYGRFGDLAHAQRCCRRVLAKKRARYRKPVIGRAGDGRRLEVRKRGKHYVVVDSTGRVYAHEKDYGAAVRTWRRTLTGLSRQAGDKVGRPFG